MSDLPNHDLKICVNRLREIEGFERGEWRHNLARLLEDIFRTLGKLEAANVESDLDEPREDPGLLHPSEGVSPVPGASEGGGLDSDRPEEDAAEESLVDEVAKEMHYRWTGGREWGPATEHMRRSYQADACAVILKLADWLAQYGDDYGSLKHVDIARHLRARVERES